MEIKLFNSIRDFFFGGMLRAIPPQDIKDIRFVLRTNHEKILADRMYNLMRDNQELASHTPFGETKSMKPNPLEELKAELISSLQKNDIDGLATIHTLIGFLDRAFALGKKSACEFLREKIDLFELPFPAKSELGKGYETGLSLVKELLEKAENTTEV